MFYFNNVFLKRDRFILCINIYKDFYFWKNTTELEDSSITSNRSYKEKALLKCLKNIGLND